MARVPWNFSGYDFPVNPSDDSGWKADEVNAENSPIGSTNSSLQWGARKSARKQCSGTLIGLSAQTQKTTMEGWKNNRTVAVLTDHTGEAKKCQLIAFEAKPIFNYSEWLHGRQTYTWQGEFIERP